MEQPLFKFKKTKIPEVILIKPKTFRDLRGLFIKIFEENHFLNSDIPFKVVEVFYSVSKYAVLRGLHFLKPPYTQARIVGCIKGDIFDVAVDIRKGSKTYGKYVSTILSEKNRYLLYIPRGFAHGFQVLSDSAEVFYLADNKYSVEADSGIIWNDPDIKIKWPIKNPILSFKDAKWPTLKEYSKENLDFRF
jgi:dTDP-4-dehydrorhamnose 3,5-epimerase